MKTQTPFSKAVPLQLRGTLPGTPMPPPGMKRPRTLPGDMQAPETPSGMPYKMGEDEEAIQTPLPLPEPDGDRSPNFDSADSESYDDSDAAADNGAGETRGVSYTETIPTDSTFNSAGANGPDGAMLPPDWPDPRGFIPPGPQPHRPRCRSTNEPVMRHTRIYHGNDNDFTTALASYYGFRDEARYGGWQGYLQRSDDFLRFCCHKHIAEMLSARGGADKSRVVYRWRKDR